MSTAASKLTPAPLAGADHLRSAVAFVGAIAAFAGCIGLTSEIVFSHPSTLKYLLTIAGPIGLVLLAGVADPLRALTVLAIVIAPFTFVISIQGIALTPLDLLGGAAFFLFLVGTTSQRAPTWLGVATTLGLVLLAPAIIHASAPPHYLSLLGSMFAVGLLANKLAKSSGGMEALLGSVVLAATIQASIAVWEFATHHTLDLYSGSGQGAYGTSYFFSFEHADRPAAALPDPISLGNVLALALPLALALIFSRRKPLIRLLLIIAAAIIVLALALTLSRMSWIGGTVGSVAVILLLPRHRLRAAVAVGGMVAVSLALALALGGNSLRQRFDSVANPTARGVSTASSDREREALWRGALQVASDHRTFGTGLGNLDDQLSRFVGLVAPSTHAHSTYIQILAETGIVGAAGVLLILLVAVAELWHSRSPRSVLPAGLLGALAAILVCWSTDYTVRYLQVAVFVAVILGAAAGIRGRDVWTIRDGRG